MILEASVITGAAGIVSVPWSSVILMMMMMCCDLICTLKLAGGQLSLSHSFPTAKMFYSLVIQNVSCMFVCMFSCVSNVGCVEHQFTVVELAARLSIISTVRSLHIVHSNVIEKFCVDSMPAACVGRSLLQYFSCFSLSR